MCVCVLLVCFVMAFFHMCREILDHQGSQVLQEVKDRGYVHCRDYIIAVIYAVADYRGVEVPLDSRVQLDPKEMR